MPQPSYDRARQDRFVAIYDSYYDRILGYSRRRTSPDDAVDIVAETFTIAWRRLEEVPDGEQALWWLYATARRVLANYHRAEHRRSSLLDALKAVPVPAPNAEADEPRRVAAALAKVSVAERELLLLLAWEELDVAAVAVVLRCSRNAARIRAHRARRRFAAALAAVDAASEAAVDLKCTSLAGHVIPAAGPANTLRLEERS